MKSVSWAANTGEKEFELHSIFHVNKEENNVISEIWVIDAEGNRRSGKWVAGYAEMRWVKPLLLCRVGQKVKVRSNIESRDTGGRSALTEPLDAFFTADQFFEALVGSFKQEAIDFKCETKCKSDTEFTMTVEADLPLPQGQTNPETGGSTWHYSGCKIVNTDPVNLQICTQDYAFDDLIVSSFFRVHRGPVRCEYWTILPSGIRCGGGKEACIIRLKLMKLISEAEVRGEVEALAADKGTFFFG
mmetsp:Transcript_15025/g.22507  ORF Transcript_15025/g.22507 Transcript_15025/m.22507 type:complete len:245 (-) Transcript_15025:132-866(-)